MAGPARSPKVADFSTHFSGPVAARHLVQFGADVIKVEDPRKGDGNRDFPPFLEGVGLNHLYLNVGTRSLAADANSECWAAIVPAIARWADVVIVGNRPKTARRLGLDFATLRTHNPELVYCMISGFGLTGEWAEQPAHGLNMDALAGTIPLDPEGDRPAASYRSVGTTLAGIEAALGIYAALHQRALGQGGQVVQVSIWESALSWMWRDVTTYANTGVSWPAYKDFGSRYAIYDASDGKALLVCPIERRFWERFCDVLQLGTALRGSGDWSTGVDLGAGTNDTAERTAIRDALLRKSRDEWIDLLRTADVPAAPVLDWREAMESSHALDNGFMASYRLAGREIRIPSVPVSVTSGTSLESGSHVELAERHRLKFGDLEAPPRLGEHTEEILTELGLAPANGKAGSK